jgi:membrane-associated progesterone receptor component
MYQPLFYLLLIFLPFGYLFVKRRTVKIVQESVVESMADDKKTTTSVMQPPAEDLAPPRDDPFTIEQLKKFDGSDPSKPILISIKGTLDSRLASTLI